jgi:hypothetical protein
MELIDFIKTWPYLYHMTEALNLPAISSFLKLFPADNLLRRVGFVNMVRLRRKKAIIIEFDGFSVVIRGQQPLDPECLELDPGLTLPNYIQILNRRVFFWPGTEAGPIKDGERMAQRHKESGITLRIPTSSLFEFNCHLLPAFSLHNTGAAWCENGKKSHRGVNSFFTFEQFVGPIANVAEVSFEGTINLPKDTSFASNLGGPWRIIGEDTK